MTSLCSCGGPKQLQMTPGEHQHSFTKTITKEVGYKFLLFNPKEYGKEEKKWPLLIFLHGSGERGSEIDLVKIHGPLKFEGRDTLPCVVAAPLAPLETRWSVDGLDAMLDEILEKFPIDPDRVYVTGLSMGGEGTWNFAYEHADRIAAIAPVCGRTDPSRAHRLKNVPVWAFHGAKDPIVPAYWSEEMIKNLKAAGGDATLTVYPETGHDAWTETYNNAELYAWLLKQRKRQGGP